MSFPQTSISNLIGKFDKFSSASKTALIATILIFAAIPVTVFAVFGLRTFTSKAAGGVAPIDNLVPTGLITSYTPKFSWNCSIGCNPIPNFYTILLSEKPFTQFSEFQNGWTKVVVGSSSSTINSYTNWGGWGSTGLAQATRTLKAGTIYYWQVIATFNGYTSGVGSPIELSAVQSFTTPVSPDTDKDGFSDNLEFNLGTNPKLACGVDAWPPDFDNDKSVSALDGANFSKHFGTSDRRYDLNMDGIVDRSDFNIWSNYFLKTCS